MIEPKDLRIGNYYQGASRGNIETVTWQTLRDLSEGKLNLLPIPLTEEILLKFGYIGNEPVFSEKSTIFTFGVHEIWNPFDIFLDEYYRFEIKYVHQLQNLFFSLTGEELTFK